MILPVHFDGQNTCFRVLNGWTCDLKCENGYGFTHTTANTTTFTCSDGDVWTNNVPGCASRKSTMLVMLFSSIGKPERFKISL